MDSHNIDNFFYMCCIHVYFLTILFILSDSLQYFYYDDKKINTNTISIKRFRIDITIFNGNKFKIFREIEKIILK